MADLIDTTAVVSPQAELGQNVKVGPYAVVEEDTVIGDETFIEAHATIKAQTTIGRRCRIYPYASIGTDPQDINYAGQETHLIIGDDNTIREFTTINRGTPGGGGVTRIGDHNMLMAYTHVAHDCQIGSDVVMVNLATLGGHVVIEDWAVLGGVSAVHQFCRIGAHAFIGGMTGVERDVPPFCMASGQRARLYGLNAVGLRRRGMPAETIRLLKEAYKSLFRNHGAVLAQSLDQVEAEMGDVPEVRQMIDFIRASTRGVCR
ncbi:MAG: acyl-ACP--UDP-N-acetylglucosamine O-acyltransferase [Deltaproteobacteria bacterium]|nr:acyl-ACP--UDP-N-acetylglucosamine O-acyltransferase [Deltaproteobacteria bacterium]